MILITYVACNLILNWNLKMNKNIAMQFREASTFIYVVHGATIALTSKWLSVNQLNGWIACVLFTVFSAFLFIKLKEQKVSHGWNSLFKIKITLCYLKEKQQYISHKEHQTTMKRWSFLLLFLLCFAYISVGLFMATTEKWRNLSVSQLWAIFIIGFIYCYIDTSSVSIGNQPIAFAIVALCMKWNINSKSLFFSYCRNMSTYIYLVHVFGIQWASK